MKNSNDGLVGSENIDDDVELFQHSTSVWETDGRMHRTVVL